MRVFFFVCVAVAVAVAVSIKPDIQAFSISCVCKFLLHKLAQLSDNDKHKCLAFFFCRRRLLRIVPRAFVNIINSFKKADRAQ